jgi:phosphohistidine phosphatase
MIVLVHHGDALGPDVDPMRPLSTPGRAASARLAAAAAARGVSPDVVWHSGKLRARQTAELFWRACNPAAAFSAARGLQPADPPTWMRDQLGEDDRSILIAGHMPHLAGLLRLLCGEPPDAPATVFPLHAPVTVFPPHGCVALERDGEIWKELWRLDAEA